MRLEKFNRSLDAFVAKIPERANDIKRKVALQILSGVVERTPVDTGRARGNWQVETNVRPSGVLESEDVGGGSTIAAGAAVIADAQPGDDIWISNNLDYIGRLNDGSSKQAPAGMIETTLADVGSQFA